jgi:hypothetical protein
LRTQTHENVFSAGAHQETAAQRECFALVETDATECQTTGADFCFTHDQRAGWTGFRRARRQPDGGNSARGGLFIGRDLARENNVIGAGDFLIIGKGGAGRGRNVRDGARPAGAIGQRDNAQRTMHILFDNDRRGDGAGRIGIVPMQNGPQRWRRAQHPFPVVGFRGVGYGRPAELFDRSKHGLQLDEHRGRKARRDLDVLFKEGEKTGERDAHGIGARCQLFALEDPIGIRQELVGGECSGCFRKNGDRGTKLRNAARISHRAG